MIKTSKGLDIPISGAPAQQISASKTVRTVALLGEDYNGMKPTMLVQVGDKVLKGQPLFEDKKTPGVFFTAPVAGTVREINRGDKRVFQSIVIEVHGFDQVQLKSYKHSGINSYSAEDVRKLLIESGFWTFLRTRPFSKTPAVDSTPSSIFVNVMDTNPLAPDTEVIVRERMEDFKAGVEVLSRLGVKVFVVTHPSSSVNLTGLSNVVHEKFQGAHPAGNVGTHIHHLDPVSATKTVWHVNYQDTMAIGHLFTTGIISNEKVISIAGPMAKSPRLIKTLRGASISDLTQDEVKENSGVRFVSGSVLGGRTASGAVNYLGQFHQQVSLIKEGHYREFMGWQSPGLNKYSLKNVFLSKIFPGKKFNFDTNTNGSHRSIVPIGSFEQVMPFDILPTQLLRYLMVQHSDMAINLGALELDEEDLALCTFVDPCKNEYGPVLRANLMKIEKEGI
ncbi:Na(+)-translocating NADH-quinone reductase subunit A [Peredibacter starrii]|uniref:Na(+)-translocating NADH-quinone reductase subunit A n=1 Tax=Peredibacter starrii TaxID=28202 RepID=A0AAX4HSS2_9BACT|nr:Na(+)-translocating NADH-quinone reductase subunit A [Peredibacter starrii]WPU66153.1 Na(+)-translocating NADH-quinone reductase subunit A [Peredibacter starrii]